MQATVSNRSAAEGALLEHPRSSQTPQEVLILCLVTKKSRATSILKITTTKTTFLPVKSTAESQHASTTNERNKVALQLLNDVQLEAQHAEGQHSGYQHRALLQSKLLEPAVVKSVHTCRRIFPFFLLYLQTYYLLLLNNSYPSSPVFKRMNWAQLLSTSFFFFSLLSIDFCSKNKSNLLSFH